MEQGRRGAEESSRVGEKGDKVGIVKTDVEAEATHGACQSIF